MFPEAFRASLSRPGCLNVFLFSPLGFPPFTGLLVRPFLNTHEYYGTCRLLAIRCYYHCLGLARSPWVITLSFVPCHRRLYAAGSDQVSDFKLFCTLIHLLPPKTIPVRRCVTLLFASFSLRITAYTLRFANSSPWWASSGLAPYRKCACQAHKKRRESRRFVLATQKT